MLKAGARVRSTVCGAEFVVVRAPGSEVDLRCGGHPLADLGSPAQDPVPAESGLDGGTSLGKRYADEDGTVELLVTKGGSGSLTMNGVPLAVKQAKALPASD